MPLSMQADELAPGDQNVVRRRPLAGRPDGGRGDRRGDALDDWAEVPAGEFLLQSGRIERRGMRRDVDQRRFQPLGVGMAEFERGQLLEVIVKKPWVVERRLQDQRLPARYRRAVAPVHGTVGELLADDDVRRAP